MSKELKKPTTYSEQVNILKSRGLIVDNEQEAEVFFSNVNYYRVKGYLLPFLHDDIISDLDFEKLKAIYYFDMELRNLLSKTIEKIEISLRTKLAYYSAHKYGAIGYLDENSYNLKHDHNKFKNLVDKCIKDNSNSPVVQHHKTQYGGLFPIWVIIDYFTLGMLSHFFTDMKNEDKTAIAKNSYGLNYQTMTSWLKCLADLRNRCAHYSRLYYWKFSSVPKSKKNDEYIFDRDLFSQIYYLKYLYPDKDNWERDFVNPLVEIVKKYENSIDKKDIGFPDGWEDNLKYNY